MNINLVVLGLMSDIVGVIILACTAMWNKGYSKFPQDNWRIRYGWMGLGMTFKGLKGFTPRLRWSSYWRSWAPPTVLLNIIGVVFICIGFLLQIIGNIR